MISLEWQPEYKDVFISVLFATIAYISFHYAGNAKNIFRLLKEDSEREQEKSVHLQRISGFLILGLGTFIFISVFLSKSMTFYGLNIDNITSSLTFAILLPICLSPILYFSSKNPKQYEMYPQIRLKKWTGEKYIKSIVTWFIYLAGYEFFFRGFLIFLLADNYGSWPAIIITTSIYVIVHINKNAGETIACIPIGILFGYTALYTGSFIGPFIAHTIIASLSEFFAIKANPEMEFK